MVDGDMGRNIQSSLVYLPNTFCGSKRVGPSLDIARIGEQLATQEKEDVLVRDKKGTKKNKRRERRRRMKETKRE